MVTPKDIDKDPEEFGFILDQHYQDLAVGNAMSNSQQARMEMMTEKVAGKNKNKMFVTGKKNG